MQKRLRTTRRRQKKTTGENPEVTKEKPLSSTVRVNKKSVDKLIGDRRPKQKIRVSGHPESPSMSIKDKEVVN